MTSVDPNSEYYNRTVLTPPIRLPAELYPGPEWDGTRVVYYRGRVKSLPNNRRALIGELLEERDALMARIERLATDPQPQEMQEYIETADAANSCLDRICLKLADHLISHIEHNGKAYPPAAETFAMLEPPELVEDRAILHLLVDSDWLQEVLRISGLPFRLIKPMLASAIKFTPGGMNTSASRSNGLLPVSPAASGRPG